MARARLRCAQENSLKRSIAKYLNLKCNNFSNRRPKNARESYSFDTIQPAPLDTVCNSAYTTEFLDGPEKLVERDRLGIEHKTGHALIGTLKNMNKGTDKVKAGMDKKRLEYYKKKLLARREELTKTIARTQEEGRTADEDPTVDLADKAANSYTKEFLFGMTNTDRAILNMIDAALKRIQSDEYGVCANCQEELQQKRLEAVPWAKHCIACQEKMEQGLLQ
jgi:DnaK suppressor protein